MTLLKTQNGSLFPELLENFFEGNTLGNWLPAGLRTVPAVNLAESADKFTIELAAPGLQKEDFKIDLDRRTLTISAQTQTENTDSPEPNTEQATEQRYTRREFGYSSFSRSFTLPLTANTDNITAQYQQGVLYVEVAKKEEAREKPKRIIEIS